MRIHCLVSEFQKQKGFTLLEMLIAISVFVIITTITLGIYTSVMRANKKSVSLTRLQRDSQVIMLAISKKIRQSQVTYAYYQPPDYPEPGVIPASVQELALTDADSTSYVYKLNDLTDTIQISSDGGSTFVDIPAGDVAITDLDFFVTPAMDPFTVTPNQAPVFPKVTMVLRLEPRNQAGIYVDHLIVQQTIPQRGGGY